MAAILSGGGGGGGGGRWVNSISEERDGKQKYRGSNAAEGKKGKKKPCQFRDKRTHGIIPCCIFIATMCIFFANGICHPATIAGAAILVPSLVVESA